MDVWERNSTNTQGLQNENAYNPGVRVWVCMGAEMSEWIELISFLDTVITAKIKIRALNLK